MRSIRKKTAAHFTKHLAYFHGSYTGAVATRYRPIKVSTCACRLFSLLLRGAMLAVDGHRGQEHLLLHVRPQGEHQRRGQSVREHMSHRPYSSSSSGLPTVPSLVLRTAQRECATPTLTAAHRDYAIYIGSFKLPNVNMPCLVLTVGQVECAAIIFLVVECSGGVLR